ncbi:TetR/AcrR family transcriptional regulator [Paractinoplanes atraurantiacus]|uniref:Regulatory protein, tetR family n=1 Tax=Paractinoplanes atraurantiacus TaxID=1036182 RepID=A0A285JP40_9ACTN|nr:TetR/AcrR family transcriptional regulator [Actinoplanes atraurantiacus]SNY62074.1 regulatory protein, tetR family [Actinoplanes atraurantiacus]
MSSDLTARARIRDAAIELFAERGVEAATIRDIAQAAGVSSGLLRHHFGSKEGLRDACDEYALSELLRVNAHFTEFQSLDRLTPKVLLLQRYFMRSTMDGSPSGTAMFDRMIDYGQEWLAQQPDLKVTDPRAFIGLLTVMKMSMFTMRDLLSRAVGGDVASVEGWLRVLNASLDLFSQPLITPSQADQARAQLDKIFGEEQS